MTDNTDHPVGGWVYEIDPAYDPAGEVPPTAIIGAREQGPDGRPGPVFRANPNYVASPVARMAAVADDEFVALLGGLSRGELRAPEFVDAFRLLDFEVFGSSSDGFFVVDAEADLPRRLQLFSSAAHHAGLEADFHTVSGAALAGVAVNGIALEVNPHPLGSALLPASLFAQATPHA